MEGDIADDAWLRPVRARVDAVMHFAWTVKRGLADIVSSARTWMCADLDAGSCEKRLSQVRLILAPGPSLEGGCQPHGNAPRGADRIAGEKPAKVDHVQHIGKVLSVDLKPNLHPVRLINIRAG